MRGYWKQTWLKTKKSKYRNRKVILDGRRFDSVGESVCYQYFKLLQSSLQVEILAFQEKIYLSEARILYKPDFTIYDIHSDYTYWVDFKGIRTASFALKARLWKAYGPGELKIMEIGPSRKIATTSSIVSERGHHAGKKSI